MAQGVPVPPGQNGYGKSMAAVAAGALATIVIWVIDQFLPTPMPAEISAAVQTLLTTAAVFLTPHDFGSGG